MALEEATQRPVRAVRPRSVEVPWRESLLQFKLEEPTSPLQTHWDRLMASREVDTLWSYWTCAAEESLLELSVLALQPEDVFRDAAPAGSTDGITARAGHSGRNPRGVAVPQADAGTRKPEDINPGSHTHSAGSGAFPRAEGCPPPHPRHHIQANGHGGGGRLRPTPGTGCTYGYNGCRSCTCRR